MLCPADFDDPANYHSYILNDHLNERGIRYHTKNIPSRSADRVVVMGEKITSNGDYYVQKKADGSTDYYRTVEHYRHGPRLGSNYLYLDLHVDRDPPEPIRGGVDPWDLPEATSP